MAVNIKFTVDMNEVANYVLQMNKRPLISRLQIHNEGDTLRDVKLRIASPIKDLLLPFELHLDVVPSGQTMEIPQAKDLLLNGQTLAEMKSRLTTELVISLCKEEELYAEAKQFSVTPFNYWKSISPHKELVASFVLPAHPLVDQLAHRASELVAQWGDSGSRTGYYSKDPNKVFAYIAAVYEAIKERKIGYAVAPPSHTDHDGQRIRLPHELMAENAEAGNFIEISCLFCAVLENLGLNPFLVLVPGHCFAGCWLERKTFGQPVVTDVAEIIKRLPSDIGSGKPANGELIVVECTQMNHGNAAAFETAMRTAMSELNDPLDYVVDVVAARRAGVAPLPLREDKENGSYSVQELTFPESDALKPQELDLVTPDEGRPTVYSKVEQWERRALGVDLRNSLVNAGFSKKSTIPLYCTNMTALTDALTGGLAFELINMSYDDDPPKDFEALTRFDGDLEEDLRQLRLRSPLSTEEIRKRSKVLAKASKTALEERGCNTLYLTVGMVRWYESPGAKEKPRYAPMLLYPVELVPSGPSYKLRLLDEEVLLNATLMELMKQKFKMQLPAWETLPAREKGGVDIPKIMASLKLVANEQPRWDVMKIVTVGNYDYADFILWRDIHNHHDVLANHNKLVKSMMEGRVAYKTDDEYFQRGIPQDDLVLPVPADGSQQFAIEAAMQGHTFVMHGPAGTGKSECITGTIAVKIGAGQKVALTAEKRAAIDVPRSRLEALGLGDFLLELHNANSSNKGKVLQRLEHILELAEQPPVEDSQFESSLCKLTSVKEDLNRYVQALHAVNPCGMSLYELITAYEELDKVDTDGFWMDPDAMPEPATVNLQNLNQQKEFLDSMATMVKVVGNPARHALRQVTGTEYSQVLKQKMHAAVTGYQQALQQTEQAAGQFAKVCQLPKADTYAEISSFSELAKEIVQWNGFPSSWSNAELDSTVQPLKELADLHTRAATLREQLLDSWDERFLEEDSRQLIDQFNAAANSPSFVCRFLLSKFNHKLLPLQKRTVLPEDLSGHLVRLRHYRSCLENVERMEAKYAAVLRDSFGQPPYDWQDISNKIVQAGLSDTRIRTLTRNGNEDFRIRNVGNEQSCEAAQNMTRAWEAVSAKRDYLYKTFGMRPAVTGADWIHEEIARCRAMGEQIDLLKDWTAFNRLCEQVTRSGMQCVVEAYRAGVEPERVNATYLKTLYQRLIADLVDRNPALSQFNGTVFNDRIESLRRLDKEVMVLARKEIYNKVLDHIRQVVATAKKEGPQLSSLKKVILAKGRGMTLRQIFHQHFSLIRELCPCMMFSPASMAQYLPMENNLFDLVIFDEASQIPTARAVGALARGINAMVVGDTNQMPPTSFFTSNMVDEDNWETEDLESVLDDCLAVNIPSTHLKWHYRSRHESLIAFSNKRFYDNKLLTFPSAADRNSHVHLHRISDGVYEGGTTHCNPKEAEAMIAYLRSHSTGSDSHMSVGVITFNVQQQRLVEQMLQDACRNDPQLAAWCDSVSEPVFIKNLENVQGDERDVILLGINYGPDKDGKVALNFGPLNKEGGWRRLNVAVSRAREKMEVFTSMCPEHIDLNRSNARGVHELRAFIEYAGGRQLPVDRGTLKLMDAPAGVAENLCFRLKQAGYETVRNVGCSDLRVDVAVVDPAHPDQYIMGILLDGGSYAAAKTTRDRELSQTGILQGLGWNIHRIWTLDWYDNREKELRQLLNKLELLSSD